MTRVEFVSVYPGMASFKRREELQAKLSEGWRIVACVFAPQEASMPSRMIYTLAKCVQE